MILFQSDYLALRTGRINRRAGMSLLAALSVFVATSERSRR